MSAKHSHHQTISTTPGAELLEHNLSRRTGIAPQPTRGCELKQPPAVEQPSFQANPPAAGTDRDGTPIRSGSGGPHLATVQARKWDCSGIRPDFYTANCPSCRSTIRVVLGAVTVCRGCGTPFFAETAAP